MGPKALAGISAWAPACLGLTVVGSDTLDLGLVT